MQNGIVKYSRSTIDLPFRGLIAVKVDDDKEYQPDYENNIREKLIQRIRKYKAYEGVVHFIFGWFLIILSALLLGLLIAIIVAGGSKMAYVLASIGCLYSATAGILNLSVYRKIRRVTHSNNLNRVVESAKSVWCIVFCCLFCIAAFPPALLGYEMARSL